MKTFMREGDEPEVNEVESLREDVYIEEEYEESKSAGSGYESAGSWVGERRL